MLITLLCWSLCPGGEDNYYDARDTIWMFDADTEEWEEAGGMQVKRRDHAVSTVPISDLIKYC